MKKLIYTEQHGGISIIIPSSKESIERYLGHSMTDEEYEQHVWDRSIPEDAIDPMEIDDDAIPTDREFRNAWKQSGKKIDFDLDKAKDIQLERIRRAREPKLKELDTEILMALEKGDSNKQKEVMQAKQKLRDITEDLKSLTPTSIEDIRDAWPEDLN